MFGDAAAQFDVRLHASPVAAEARAALLEAPGFGKVFTDHMVMIQYTEGRGWHDARVEARAPLQVDPASAVLHYAQEIFEGMKAYRAPDGGAILFRPEQNAKRFNASAERMSMPAMPEALFLESVRQLVSADRAWIPDGADGSLYLRPFMIASEVFLGVRPSKEYLYMVIASSVGSYFKGASETVSVWISQNDTRAAPGGTGAAKCGGNYAASLRAQGEAMRQGCDQTLFLDAAHRRYVEELGGMNVFFVFDDGTMSTPALDGTILPGITRDAIMTLAREKGVEVREERYGVDQWRADAASGRLREAFACGTAAVIAPIGRLKSPDGEFTIGDPDKSGPVTTSLRDTLVSIQRGLTNDAHGWVHKVF
ncbi:MAG TPA: branched-chain amino acid aminotransferase [Caulobacteraceae bacterium]|jgi:branched-chain amino acid aminotransferase|nr:branched-chain amino acid aminotransferase [Caulobacteraceae bacterium]